MSPADRSMFDLAPGFRTLADVLISRWLATHPGNPLIPIPTLRSQSAQDTAVSTGHSLTHHSEHLAHPPDGKSWAMDAVPHSLLSKPNYSPSDPLWWDLGALATSLGLRWGGMWDRPAPPPVGFPPRDRSAMWDPSHIGWRGPGSTPPLPPLPPTSAVS